MTTQSLQKLEDRVKAMIGLTYLVNAVSHKVLSFRIDDDKLTMVSDKKWFTVELANAPRLLESFLETDNEEPDVLPAKPTSAVLSTVPDLKAILLDNIKKVQESKDYIPQANTIAKQVNTLINMVNAEIAFNKAQGK